MLGRLLARIERACRITRVSNPAYLIASHIKPWRLATNPERLSKYNGLMLAPQADYLFDRGFISFADGRLLISEVADERSLVKLGLKSNAGIIRYALEHRLVHSEAMFAGCDRCESQSSGPESFRPPGTDRAAFRLREQTSRSKVGTVGSSAGERQ